MLLRIEFRETGFAFQEWCKKLFEETIGEGNVRVTEFPFPVIDQSPRQVCSNPRRFLAWLLVFRIHYDDNISLHLRYDTRLIIQRGSITKYS